ncbi:lytic transglycosylase domain-containing protein [uncultured Enterovirga sp.]|uniref:lytic transglycosylase domain-containing protein n=1 Tax=uncultured Enterovirga sp. TaxID=2026352 RepID=UPI0035CA72DA
MAAAIGLGLVASQVDRTAEAQNAAIVDAAGRVLPVRAAATRPDLAVRVPKGPCTEATALSPEAARVLVARVAGEEEFYPEFVLAVAKIESRFVSTALSDKGAYGLMQLMPDTAKRFEVDLCDPESNVRGGIRLLRSLHARYRNPLYILAAYNAGEEAVRKSRGVPPYPETVRFIADVLNDFYTRPSPGGEKASARLAASASPGIFEFEPAKPAAAPDRAKPVASPPPPTVAAAPRWNDGFVLHVD